MTGDLSKRGDASIRTFLAVDLPDRERGKLARLATEFSPFASVLRWSSPDLLHITLRFLGPVAPARIEQVKQAAAVATSGVAPFSLRLSGLGTFPHERAPRVLWVGLERDEGYRSLEALFGRLEDALDARGLGREERAFAPHITLARTRDEISSAQRRALGEAIAAVRQRNRVTGAFAVRELIVMRSDLSRTGPRYTPLATLPLAP